jgi:hypothetical protein
MILTPILKLQMTVQRYWYIWGQWNIICSPLIIVQVIKPELILICQMVLSVAIILPYEESRVVGLKLDHFLIFQVMKITFLKFIIRILTRILM